MSSQNKELKNLLVINSSARNRNAKSRNLSETLIGHWQKIQLNTKIQHRELGNQSIPHITEEWISAAFKPIENRTQDEFNALKKSDEYIKELKDADIIVVATPMYNWSIPSSLKAYIDQIVRINETWKYNPDNIQNPYIGLLTNKKVVLLLTRGSQGYEKGGYNEHIDFQTDYLKRVFNVMGIDEIHVITLDGAANNQEEYNKNIAIAHQETIQLIESISS
ncbi:MULTISPECIES: FMN-dependent NADH-azoreductase [unclassified Sphingobacterium]|uniref:FMN-dependent NADH-azoreductase n=1 Tax=unclassified Sphingobacterium TaxID=2609468 RepID=UPI00104AD0C9|nr:MULTISPECIES: NAD(P)H-dependent oxidoreductase [unclassified Sphingobacterium]MCS3556262.1 FMN-dependent NADH-azoreductase [Sphingobacterium sp. JUb21]TCR08632.1 FMN-dependent NADH-azoreductase [Sphingobacterium sp. JUb20]